MWSRHVWSTTALDGRCSSRNRRCNWWQDEERRLGIWQSVKKVNRQLVELHHHSPRNSHIRHVFATLRGRYTSISIVIHLYAPYAEKWKDMTGKPKTRTLAKSVEWRYWFLTHRWGVLSVRWPLVSVGTDGEMLQQLPVTRLCWWSGHLPEGPAVFLSEMTVATKKQKNLLCQVSIYLLRAAIIVSSEQKDFFCEGRTVR